MSRHGRHAKATARYSARHARPGTPGAATLLSTTVKVVPASVVIGAAGSAMMLSGTASAATTAHHSRYTVVSGDTLSAISARFCGTSANYRSLAAASGIGNPDLIYPGQSIRLACHSAATLAADPAPRRDGDGDHDGDNGDARPAHATHRNPPPPAGHVATAGMSGFEACVIARESGGNPAAVNPTSGAGGLFQFLPSTWAALGYAGAYPGGAQTAPVSVQKAAFAKEYAQSGSAPWAPYDGC